jgi:hypothetical protein
MPGPPVLGSVPAELPDAILLMQVDRMAAVL